jgi:hypothetical protein
MTITEELLGKDRGGARFVLAGIAMHAIIASDVERVESPSKIPGLAFDLAEGMLLELERREAEGR